MGKTLSGALVSTLVGLGASNLGIIPYEAPAYGWSSSTYFRWRCLCFSSRQTSGASCGPRGLS
ncbi:hypothetical protein QJS10_CPA01g02387 [Acorus calamus]|uniref:Uncharacterized protein n=1 Tax=Acorus calamus TaxID=4465 RepID=A0AAV9FJ05_ACOCL|nr:hypothetical protein QJS10_CPA01g02387 [Acorus calamus]